MKLAVFVSVVIFMALGTSGCLVSESKYEAAVADMESAKVELEKGRMVKNALERQIETLRSQNEKVNADLEMMASEVQRIKEGRENERAHLENRERELEEKTKVLGKKMVALQREYQKIKSQNRALKDTIVRYQKELREARKSPVPPKTPPPVISKQPAKESIPEKSSSPVASPSRPKVAPVTAPLTGTLAPVNINTASANDLVLFLGLTKEMAEKVVANRPYRLRGELVAKNVVPKATFDVIKDRITATR